MVMLLMTLGEPYPPKPPKFRHFVLPFVFS